MSKDATIVGTSKVINVALSALVKSPDNARQIDDKVLDRALLDHVLQGGTLPPLYVYRDGGQWAVIDGSRRLRAYQKAHEQGHEFSEGIPCIETKEADPLVRTVESVLRNEVKHFTTVELADVYKKLVQGGWKQADVARQFSKTAGHVSQMITISEHATPQVRRQLTTGAITVIDAYNAIKQVLASTPPKPAKPAVEEGPSDEPPATEPKPKPEPKPEPEPTVDEIASALEKARNVTRTTNTRVKDATRKLKDEDDFSLSPDEKAAWKLLDRHGLDGVLNILHRATRLSEKLVPADAPKGTKAGIVKLRKAIDKLIACYNEELNQE